MSSLEEKVEDLKIIENKDVETEEVESVKENVETGNDDGDESKENDSAAAKKKNKKKKKKAKAASEENCPEAANATPAEEAEVLKELSENASDEKLCAFCKKTGPIKRCSKRHAKCLPKMFCNETCEALAHEDKKAALVKKEASKVAAAKKKGMKNKDWKNTDSGQFWWHDQ